MFTKAELALFAPPVVGVRRLLSRDDQAHRPLYHGVAYCQAVDHAAQGQILRIGPQSIETCKWAPPVLGLKEARTKFEQGLSPRLESGSPGLLLARLDLMPDQAEVVIVRGEPGLLSRMTELAGSHNLFQEEKQSISRSALGSQGDKGLQPGKGLLGVVNRTLASLSGGSAFQALTRRMFSSGLITAGFEALISRSMADMSVCRNSTVIPLLTGQVNASFFCTGGITWGGNRADQLSSGWPVDIFSEVLRQLND